MPVAASSLCAPGKSKSKLPVLLLAQTWCSKRQEDDTTPCDSEAPREARHVLSLVRQPAVAPSSGEGARLRA